MSLEAETPKTVLENKTILLTNGIVANWCLLLDDTKTTQPTPPPHRQTDRGRTPPLSNTCYMPTPTDRQRKAQAGPVNRRNGHTTCRPSTSIGK